MVKKTLCLLLIGVLLIVPLFWDAITRTCLKAGIDRYCILYFGSPLQIDSMSREGKYWVLESPSLQPSGARLSAGRMFFRFEIHPLLRSIDLEITVDDSRIDLKEEGSNLEEVFSEIFSKAIPSWIFKIHTSLQIKDGKVYWQEKGKEGVKQYVADVSIHVQSDEAAKQGSLSLYLSGRENTGNLFELAMFKEKNDPLNADLRFKNVECGKIAKIYQALGAPFYSWEVATGTIDGTLHLFHPEKKRAYLWGEAELHDLTFINSKLEMKASIGKASAKLETHVEDAGVPRITGNLLLEKGAQLEIAREGAPYWSLNDVHGDIAFLPGEGITLMFQGECSHRQDSFGIEIKGEASVFDDTQAAIDITCGIMTDEKKDCLLKLSMRQLGFMYNTAEIQAVNIGKEEFSLFQRALLPLLPESQSFEVRKGSIDLEAIAYLEGYRITDVKIDKLLARDLKINVDPMDLNLHLEKTAGALSINLAEPDPLSSLDADFELSGGMIQCLGINGNAWEFKDLLTTVSVRRGILQKSEIKGNSHGLKGAIDVDWMQKGQFLTLNFTGPAKNISTFLPLAFTKGVENAFAEDTVNIVGTMSWKGPVSTFNGEMRFRHPRSTASDTIFFGFDLEESSDALWKKQEGVKLAASYWDAASLEAMRKVMPPIASPMLLFESNWILAESGVAGLALRKGWFRADNISFEHYVTPFVFSRSQLDMKGHGNLEGVFDHQCVAIEYEADSLEMENPHFIFQIPKVGALKKGKLDKKAAAVHYFDFLKGHHFGMIPFERGTYLEKNSGLFIADVNALVILEGQEVHFLEMTANSQGLMASGEVDLDFNPHDDKKLSIDIRINSLEGPLDAVKSAFCAFCPDWNLLHLPVFGNVSLQGHAANLSLVFGEGSVQFDTHFQGMITDFSTSFLDNKLSLSGLKMNFSYDHAKNALNLSNIYGDLHLSGLKGGEKYVVSGEYVRFPNLLKGISEFDIWIGDLSRDFSRLVGRTLPEEHPGNTPLVALHINHELTHFGDVHPANFQLLLKDDWMTVDTFALGANVRLSTLFHDLQKLAKTRLVSESIPFSNAIANLKKAQGDFFAKVEYKEKFGELAFQATGTDFRLNDYHFKNFAVKGKKQEDTFCLNHLSLDDISCQGFINICSDGLHFNQLKMHFGDAVAMKMDGQYSEKLETVDAQIREMDVNFANIDENLTLVAQAVKGSGLSGRMSGSGNLSVSMMKEDSSFKAEAILDVSFASWGINGIPFQDVRNVSCHFLSDKGITLRNLNVDILSEDLESSKAHLTVEKVAYEFQNEGNLFERLQINVPVKNLDWFTKTLEKSFPGLVTQACAEMIQNCKRDGELSLELQYEFNPPYTAMALRVLDGRYIFWNNELDLKDFLLEYDPFEFKIASRAKIGEKHVTVEARSASPTLMDGILTVTDQSFESSLDPKRGTLEVHWANDTHSGIAIKSVLGNFSGLNFNLREDPLQPLSKLAIHLMGNIDIDARDAVALVPKEFSKKIEEWKIGDGYQLAGKWKIKKTSAGKDYPNNLHFQGKLLGQGFGILGYRFDQLESNLEYTSSAVRIRHLSIADFAGNLEADQIELVKSVSGDWHIAMPKMEIHKLVPSNLTGLEMHSRTQKSPLVIRNLLLEGFQGTLENSKSFIGKGSLRFSNKIKSRFQNPLFQIPSDILSRIGLDLSVLTPVTGSIEYRLQDGKVFLTKLRDVYSDRRLSRFYLSPASSSYMDFGGHLNVQVRMKQNNLLFKFAELFTVNITGELAKPLYSFQRQSKEDVASQK